MKLTVDSGGGLVFVLCPCLRTAVAPTCTIDPEHGVR